MKKQQDRGCQNCEFWTEATEAHNEERWGFCNRYPPTPMAVVAEDGSDAVDCLRAWTVLPYVCGEHTPILQ